MKFLITERQLKLFENEYKKDDLNNIKEFFDKNYSNKINYESEIFFGNENLLRIIFDNVLIDIWSSGNFIMWIDGKKYYGENLNDIKKILKQNLKEGLGDKIKSRATDQEKQSIEYFTKKVKDGEVIKGMDYSTYNKLSDEIKTLNWKNLNKDRNDWGFLYQLAQNEPYKTLIKNILVDLTKDKDFVYRIADNFHWSDGSNGRISFDSLNHYITDAGQGTFADKLEYFIENNKQKIEDWILYSYSSSEPSDFIKERYKDFQYNPNDEFTW